MILDSSFLIDLMNAHEDAVALASHVESIDAIQRVPAQVVYELSVGVGYSETPDAEVAKIRRVLDARPVVETTDGISRLAGRLDGQLRRSGDRVAVNDVLIGATARYFEEPIVTGTPDDFEPIPGVEVTTYRDR